jgi:hypothetical protein
LESRLASWAQTAALHFPLLLELAYQSASLALSAQTVSSAVAPHCLLRLAGDGMAAPQNPPFAQAHLLRPAHRLPRRGLQLAAAQSPRRYSCRHWPRRAKSICHSSDCTSRDAHRSARRR